MKTELTYEMRSLLSAQAECSRRLTAANEAVSQAENQLDNVLEAGADSSSPRRVLHEARRLQQVAGDTRANIAAELEHQTAAVIQRAAAVRTNAAQTELDALLKKFTPSLSYQETQANERT